MSEAYVIRMGIIVEFIVRQSGLFPFNADAKPGELSAQVS
jgi:hypothetical protein